MKAASLTAVSEAVVEAAFLFLGVELIHIIGVVEREATAIETEPWGFSSPNMFLNSCVKVLTVLTPRQVLEATQHIERELGRTMKSVDGAYHDRIIDIDILLYDDISLNEPDLVIPHPHMQEREFVMIPLREIM